MSVAMENVALHERISREARVDELTGLANHRHFQESLALEGDRMRRFRRPLALAMIDVDHFKAFNDTYGHQLGDEVLRAVAGAVRDVVRSTDVPARYGGEELAVVLPDTDLDGAFAAGEQIRRAVEAVRVAVARRRAAARDGERRGRRRGAAGAGRRADRRRRRRPLRGQARRTQPHGPRGRAGRRALRTLSTTAM